MTFHKEGIPSMLITLLFISVINTLGVFFFADFMLINYLIWALSAFLFIAILQFFRSPKRTPQLEINKVISPADGKIVVIEEVEENEYFKDKRIQVSIFMSPLNVHINWYPINGVIKYLRYHAGKYLVAFHPKSSTENERTTIVLEGENSVEILLRQIAGAMARRIVYYGTESQNIAQGEQLGFIKFGSRVDLFLPLNSKIKVALGDKVKGLQTTIAELD